MAAKLGLLLNLTAHITTDCWAESPVFQNIRFRQAIRTSLPAGSLIYLDAQNASEPCLLDALYRDLHAEGCWQLLSRQGEASRRGKQRPRHRKSPGAYVLLGSGAWARWRMQTYTKIQSSRNTSALFLALVPSADLGEVRPLLWEAWRRHSVADYTVILTPDHEKAGDGRWEAWTAFPYAERTGLCGRVQGAGTFRKWDLYGSNQSWTRDSIFPPKIPKDYDYGGCLLPVNLQYDANIFSPGYLNPEGYAMAMLNALTDFLHVTAKRVPAPKNQFDTTPGAPDWSWYDALAGLESGEVDVLVGQYSYTDWRYGRYSALGPHGMFNYRWFLPVPLPSFLPIMPHLALPTAVVTYMVLGLAAAVAVLLLASARNSVLLVWSMIVEQPIPQTSLDGITLASRVVILSSLVSFVNVNVLIKSTIVTTMSRPSLSSGMKTVEELADLDKLVIGLDSPLTSTLLNISEIPAERSLLNRSEECFLNFTDCVRRLQSWAFSDDDTMYALACGEDILEFSTAGSARFTVYTLKEPLHHSIYGWYGRKNFPMADRANRLFLLLHQSGLQALWAGMLRTNISAVNEFSRSPYFRRIHRAIPFRRVSNLFVMLALGEAAAFVVFLLEHVAHRCAGRLVRKGRPPKPSWIP